MTRYLLKWAGVVVAGLMLSAGPAAADGPHRSYKDGPYMHEATGNWGGIYIGAAVGYSYSASNLRHDWDDGVTTSADRYSIDQDGLTGTLTVGFDRHSGGALVWGLFADYTFGSIKDTVVLATAPDVLRFRLEDNWAVGGRLGIIHHGALWYMTAGYTGINVSFADLDDTLHGYFLGAGLEKDIGRNFRLKLEYRFADYGRETMFDGTAGCCDARIRVDSSTHSVRLGMSYVFAHREEYRHESLK